MSDTFICSKCNQSLTIDKKESGKYGKRCKECLKQAKLSSNKREREKDIDKTDIKSTIWQGGKYSGTIFERVKQNTINCCVGGKQKCFSISKFENKDKAIEEAKIYRKNKSDELDLTINKYKLIFNQDNIPTYIIVKLSKNYVMLCDYSDLDMIKETYLCVSRSGSENSQNYCVLSSSKITSFHKIKTGFEMTDHINGYPLDNRSCNLRNTNHKENNNNSSNIHKAYVNKHKDGYEAVLVVNNNRYEKNIISKIFENKNQATIYLEEEKIKIDRHLYQEDGNKLNLKKEFEEIMSKYAEGFKWNDKIVDQEQEEILKDYNIIKNEKNKSNKDTKLEIYNLFKTQIDETWSIESIDHNKVSQRKVEHISYNEITYKFCNKCLKWLNIIQYTKCSSRYDGLTSQCKTCLKMKKQKTS